MIAPWGNSRTSARSDRHSESGTTAHRPIGGSADARLALAQDPTTPQMTLIDLASDPSELVRKAVASRADAPAQALRPLTRDHDRQVREAVARNPSTSIANLMRLVKDADRWVRWAVAGNPACDESIRQVMSETSDKELRGLLAESRELEPELAAKLIDDVSPEVRERLATHTHDPDVITALLADRTARVRKGVARNPRTTAEQRSALAADPVVDVRAALVRAVELERGGSGPPGRRPLGAGPTGDGDVRVRSAAHPAVARSRCRRDGGQRGTGLPPRRRQRLRRAGAPHRAPALRHRCGSIGWRHRPVGPRSRVTAPPRADDEK